MIKPINSLVKQLDLRNENIGQFETPYEELEPIIKMQTFLWDEYIRT